ncbi:MAG: tryptophan-rich sensory protein [Erysipelotrichaceae bacterium]|nr:tryptophan-rich sensory protein [Erysipelotrichaceae bacterium]
MKNKIYRILRTILPVVITGVLGSVFMIIGKVDYENLVKPPLSPNKIVFPIAWTILYIVIAISAFLYDKKVDNKEDKIKGLIIYYIGLFFNAFWTLFYFTLDMKVFSSIWLGALYVISASNYVIFSRKNKISGYLFLPYLVWLLFALYLNIGTAILN